MGLDGHLLAWCGGLMEHQGAIVEESRRNRAMFTFLIPQRDGVFTGAKALGRSRLYAALKRRSSPRRSSHRSTLPPRFFHRAALPPRALPPLHSSTAPLFHRATLPPRHSSTAPLFHRAALPRRRSSTAPALPPRHSSTARTVRERSSFARLDSRGRLSLHMSPRRCVLAWAGVWLRLYLALKRRLALSGHNSLVVRSVVLLVSSSGQECPRHIFFCEEFYEQ